jgi:HlyD family secretion protein
MQDDGHIGTPSDALIRVFESEAGEIRSAPEPLRARATLWLLAGLLVSLVGVASVFKVDRMVTSELGTVVTTDPTIVLQALDPSIIKTLDVKEGDRVKKGQLLATLDSTFAAADVRSLRLQLASLNAQISRDQAELAGRPYDVSLDADPMDILYQTVQKNYYNQRKSQYHAQVNAFEEQMALAQATLKRLTNDEQYYQGRASVAKEIEEMRADLEATKVGSKLNLLIATDQKLELERFREADAGGKAETLHQLAAAMFNRDAFIQQWQGQASQELITARNQRDAAVEQLAKAEKHQDLVRLNAPDDAVVLTMAKLSVGSVLREADPFITLALLRSPMEAEVYISPRDVGFIRPGDRVTIKLDAFHFIEHGTAEGEVLWISDGTFNAAPGTASVSAVGSSGTGAADAQGKPTDAYYKMRVRFTNVQLRNVPTTFRLIPGMTLTADVHLGTRSLLMYLSRGMVRGIGEAMREP